MPALFHASRVPGGRLSVWGATTLAVGLGVAFLFSTTGTRVHAEDKNEYGLGSHCVVQFQRDQLGVAAATPVSPTCPEANGAPTYVEGKLKHLTSEWVVITPVEGPGREFWIPRSSVLMLEFGPKSEAGAPVQSNKP